MTFDPLFPQRSSSDASNDQESRLVGELSAVVTRMSGLLLAHETVDTVLRLITTLAAEAISVSSGAGVTLADAHGHRETTAATDPLVERADEVQYELNEGPCLAAIATRTPLRTDDMSAEQRWPRWAAAAQELGLAATLTAPLIAGHVCLGAIKVYATEPGAFDGRSEYMLELFAAQAAILLANVQSQEDARRLSSDLRTALSQRDLIGQAKGILMHSRRVDEEGAFALLVAASQREHKKLSEVADQLVLDTARRRR